MHFHLPTQITAFGLYHISWMFYIILPSPIYTIIHLFSPLKNIFHNKYNLRETCFQSRTCFLSPPTTSLATDMEFVTQECPPQYFLVYKWACNLKWHNKGKSKTFVRATETKGFLFPLHLTMVGVKLECCSQLAITWLSRIKPTNKGKLS